MKWTFQGRLVRWQSQWHRGTCWNWAEEPRKSEGRPAQNLTHRQASETAVQIKEHCKVFNNNNKRLNCAYYLTSVPLTCISCTKGQFVAVWRIFLEFSKSLLQGHFLPHHCRSSRMPCQHLTSPYAGCQAAENGRWALASSRTADHGPRVSSTAGWLAWLASQVWLLRCFHFHGGPRVGSGDLEQKRRPVLIYFFPVDTTYRLWPHLSTST